MQGFRVAIAVLALALASACGGGDGNGTADDDGPTPEDYIAEANAVCVAQQENQPEPSEPKTAAEFVTALRAQIADIKQLQTDLRKIEPPVEDREDIEQWLDLGDQQVEALEDGLPDAEEAAKGGDLAATAAAYQPAADRFAELSTEDTFAIDYGITACADEEAEIDE